MEGVRTAESGRLIKAAYAHPFFEILRLSLAQLYFLLFSVSFFDRLHGTIVAGTMAPWLHGTMAWYHGTMVRYHGTMVPWSHGSMLPWYHGTTVSWFHGTMVPWYHGAMVPWYHATMVP